MLVRVTSAANAPVKALAEVQKRLDRACYRARQVDIYNWRQALRNQPSVEQALSKTVSSAAFAMLAHRHPALCIVHAGLA